VDLDLHDGIPLVTLAAVGAAGPVVRFPDPLLRQFLECYFTNMDRDVSTASRSRSTGGPPLVDVDDLLGPARTGTVRTERSRRTRAALVAGVRDELRQAGSFTAEAVADRASCSPATFYGHFATKDDALASAFRLTLIDLVGRLEASLSADRLVRLGLPDAVEAWVADQVAFFGEENLLFRAALARLPFHRGIRHAYREAERLALAHLEAVIVEGQRVGAIRTGEPRDLAEAFLILSQGLNNPHAISSGGAGVRPHLVRSLVAALAPQADS
jgi:AcrR family transcriptional regulator